MFKLFTGYTMIYIVAVLMSLAFEGGAGIVSTRLDGATDADDVTLTVDSTSGFIDPSGAFQVLIYINNEVMTYDDVSNATTFAGVLRGQFGTVSADHADNTIVYNDAAGAINSLAIYNLATELENVGSITGVFNVGLAFVKAVPSILTWDYAYLEGTNQVIMLFLLTFSIGFVAALIGLLIGLAQSIF